MRVKMQRILIVLFIFYSVLGGSANEQIGSYMNEYYELLALAGIVERPTLIYQSLSRNAWQLPPSNVDHPWKLRIEREKAWNRIEGANWNIISPQFLLSYNTAYAQGSNDGSFWQGKGANGMISGGLHFSWKWISATLSPELWFAQNKEFGLMPPNPSLSEYSYPNSGIDMPQRFGDELVFGYGFGQSDLRLNISWFTMGISNENLWFGPAQVNPILMSNNASGFPHFDIGTRKVRTFLGEIEAALLWGILSESDYFDEDESNNHRFFTSLTLGYSPPFLDSLALGVARVMYTPWENLRFYDFVRLIDPRLTGPGAGEDYPGKDDRDQMISLTLDWFLKQAMFEVYLEWARNDYAPDLRWALSYPQHAQGYTVGFRKLIWTQQNKMISIIAEVTELAKPFDAGGVGPSYYRHHKVIQGYTHLGQVLGAPIGPGSNSQFLCADYYDKWGKITIFFQRIAYDQDYYFATFTVPDNENVEWIGGAGGVVFLPPVDLNFELAVSDNWNRNYEKENDVWNVYVALTCQYNF